MQRVVLRLLAGVAIWGAAIARAEEVPDLKSPALVQHGRDLFGETCTYCHGENAAGSASGAPGLQGRTDLGAQEIFDTISEGRIRGTNIMPAWKESLSQSDRWALTAYILSIAVAPGGSKQ
jgi:mono/diheme cytochrome c family protein